MSGVLQGVKESSHHVGAPAAVKANPSCQTPSLGCASCVVTLDCVFEFILKVGKHSNNEHISVSSTCFPCCSFHFVTLESGAGHIWNVHCVPFPKTKTATIARHFEQDQCLLSVSEQNISPNMLAEALCGSQKLFCVSLIIAFVGHCGGDVVERHKCQHQ
jgi:hypothetical protein